MKRLLVLSILAAAALVFVSKAHAQAIETAIEPGSYTAVGVTGSSFQVDYGQRRAAGGSIYLDANLYRRLGVEAEARALIFNEDEGVHQTTYLAGPRVSTHGRGLRPFSKLLAGRGEFRFPFGYAHGSYFVVAAGGGLDWRPGSSRSRFLIRVLDAEYQFWPQFSFGELHPYGISSGLSVRVW
jgi:hypothetical protein